MESQLIAIDGNWYLTTAFLLLIQINFEIFLFPGLLFLLITGLAILPTRHLFHSHAQRKRAYEKEISSKTKELELLVESLENTIVELEDSKEKLYQNNLFKEKLAMIIIHDLQSPLRFLFEATRRVNDKASGKQFAELPDASLELLKATGIIYRFVDDFGWWLTSMGKNFIIQNAAINLVDLLIELEQFFREQLKAKENRMIFQTYKSQVIYTDRQLVKIIIRNIIDNANKNIENGTIEITMQAANDRGSIIITDNGKGMSDTQLRRIDQILKEHSKYHNEKESGYGFRFISDLSELLKVSVDIQSEFGHGTKVVLSNFKIFNP